MLLSHNIFQVFIFVKHFYNVMGDIQNDLNIKGGRIVKKGEKGDGFIFDARSWMLDIPILDFGIRISELFLNRLHQPAEKAVFSSGAGYNANSSHLFFFFIVCLNFKTAKFNSIDVSVSVVCRSSSRSSAIISPLFRIRAFCLGSS